MEDSVSMFVAARRPFLVELSVIARRSAAFVELTEVRNRGCEPVAAASGSRGSTR